MILSARVTNWKHWDNCSLDQINIHHEKEIQHSQIPCSILRSLMNTFPPRFLRSCKKRGRRRDGLRTSRPGGRPAGRSSTARRACPSGVTGNTRRNSAAATHLRRRRSVAGIRPSPGQGDRRHRPRAHTDASVPPEADSESSPVVRGRQPAARARTRRAIVSIAQLAAGG